MALKFLIFCGTPQQSVGNTLGTHALRQCSAGLSSFRALGAEDLRAPLALSHPSKGSWIRLNPAYLGRFVV
ncbi:hypothetical protein TNCV_617061 [Trichonephila clavipes]|nr:hypothetical protein TNCV_617061 [Trichonephila clavipes]